MIRFIFIIFVGLIIILGGCFKKPLPLKTAEYVDLNQYAGVWYEIARLPNSFEKGCRCVKAEYSLKNDDIVVKNSCLRGKRAKHSVVKGKAWQVKGSNGSKLKVQFFWPFKGDYWIIYVDKKYNHAVVGIPNRKYLWFLSRTSYISDDEYDQLRMIAEREKFDLTHLIKTDQSNCDFERE